MALLSLGFANNSNFDYISGYLLLDFHPKMNCEMEHFYRSCGFWILFPEPCRGKPVYQPVEPSYRKPVAWSDRCFCIEPFFICG